MTDNLIQLDQHRPAPPKEDNVSKFFSGLLQALDHLIEEKRKEREANRPHLLEED